MLPRSSFASLVHPARTALAPWLAAGAIMVAPGCTREGETCGAECPAPSGFEYIVVGSGAGGGPVAARLARAGKRVLLLEAGEDVADAPTYQVPAMHALSTEDSTMAWWYFVHHHADPAEDALDSKITKEGVLYPRGSALGGSTAVNAMVTVLPSRSDWNHLAELTQDRGFRADAMAPYEARVREWLSIEIPDPSIALGDRKVSSYLAAAAAVSQGESLTLGKAPGDLVGSGSALAGLLRRDVNEALRSAEATGIFRLPLATRNGHRNGTRELLKRTVAEGFPLTIRTSAFVTRVLWDAHAAAPTAVGVEYVAGSAVYGASLHPSAAPEDREQAFASKETILAAGTFNTPQLLQLSGVGDAAELEKLGIEPRVALPGVGHNLQDRYEAPVVSELQTPIELLRRCKLGEADDPCMDDWSKGQGVYRTPGFLASVLMRTSPDLPLANLQVFAVPTDARGYYPGYAKDSAAAKNRFTWLLLEAHTHNHDGTVRITSRDPFRRPDIRFNLFDEKAPLADPDLRAMVEGVKFVRRVQKEMRGLVTEDPVTEVWPGPDVATDDQIAAFVRKETWGHHACCTSKMGLEDDAVVDPQFRVRGAKRLRVVDASVFPEIPGTFIAMPLYMLAERAADVILRGGP